MDKALCRIEQTLKTCHSNLFFRKLVQIMIFDLDDNLRARQGLINFFYLVTLKKKKNCLGTHRNSNKVDASMVWRVLLCDSDIVLGRLYIIKTI